MKTSKSWEKVSLQEWLEDFVESGCELEDLESLLDQQREEMVEEMKRDIKKPFNKKEFVKLANEVSKILEEEKRTMTGAYDVTTRAGKKRFRDMLRELVE